MKEALGKRQHGFWVQPSGFQRLHLSFFMQVFTKQELPHLHPRFKSAGRSFQETLDNINPIMEGHRRGILLGSGISGLVSGGVKALHSCGVCVCTAA